jgi:hypothetical protein
MSEMIERVAMRIVGESFDTIAIWQARDYARAAIEAMREPSDEAKAAFNEYAQCIGSFDSGWDALIRHWLTAGVA